MKIVSSMVKMSSNRSAAELDLTTLESRTRLGRMSRDDLVSIGSGFTEEARSTYTAEVRSESLVRQAGESDMADAATMVQGLASMVTGQEVSITRVDQTPIQGGALADRGWSSPISPESRGMEAMVRETRIRFEEEEVGFSSRGEVRTADGRAIDFTLDLTMDRSFSLVSRRETLLRANSGPLTDPLVISLDGRVPRLTDTRFSFDLDGDGVKDEISFVSRGSGFLAFDKNKDGRINDGTELFGPTSGNGFEDLALYDQDMNGWIDENDPVFSQLSVWTRDDAGRDRLVSLKEAGLGAIFLGAAATSFDLKGEENRLLGQVASSGLFLFEDGRAGVVQEIDLAMEAEEDGSGSSGLGDLALGGPFRLDAAALGVSGPAAGSLSGENPFDQLKDALEALKEKMRRLLENRGKPPGERMDQGSLYRASTPDRASFLMPKGSIRSRRTSIISSSPVTSKI